MKRLDTDRNLKFEYSFTNKKIKEILKWLLMNNSIATLHILFGDKVNFFHKHKGDFDTTIETDCFAFFKALETLYDNEQKVNKKNESMSLSLIKKTNKIRNYKYQKKEKCEKMNFLVNHKSIILSMRNEEKLSLRDIANQLEKRGYIKKNSFKFSSKQSVSHSLIAEFLKKGGFND